MLSKHNDPVVSVFLEPVPCLHKGAAYCPWACLASQQAQTPDFSAAKSISKHGQFGPFCDAPATQVVATSLEDWISKVEGQIETREFVVQHRVTEERPKKVAL